jgi:hypothetical protein
VKTLIAALALVTLISGPTFAQTATRATVETHVNTNCDSPYIGNWKHGYPRDDDSC